MADNTIDSVIEKLKTLPNKPGVYEFFNIEGVIIYVGKAKDLKKRVSSYFVKNHDSAKTRILVRNIVEVQHIVVETETDALLLENNLIKKYQPRYNVLLKDDKTYPWICIKNENFPRVFSTRNYIKDGSKYFGPFTSGSMVKTILELVRQIYQIRTCGLSLNDENILNNKFKVCLEFHIGNCKGPCIGAQSAGEYAEYVEQIQHILKGNIIGVIHVLKEKMRKFSDSFRFEEAQMIKEKLHLLESFQSKSTIVNPSITDIDVYSIIDDNEFAYINYLKVVNGSIIQVHTIEIKKKLSETKEELLPLGIVEVREKFHSESKEIIVPFELDYKIDLVKITVPVKGDRKKLLELSEKNVRLYRIEKMKQFENVDPLKHSKRIMNTLKNDLHLLEMPVHIECFDNSNIQGSFPVAACVVFKNARPSKKDYRHFNVKTVDGPNDFASMEEIVYRRYKRMLDERESLPQLVIIDGGKGQLSSAMKSIEKLDLRGKISIIGIAKKLEEIYFPNDSVPIYLDKNSESLKLIQHARNEAHRFGITFHRNKRSNHFLDSELLNIEGIGEKTMELLFKKMGSVLEMKKANLEDLVKIVGKAKAKLLYTYFQGKNAK